MTTGLGERLRRLLGLEAKASKTAKFIAWASGGQPVWTPRDFASLAREGFLKNAIVYRAVRMIAEAAGSVPLYLFDGEKEIDEHPLLQLLKRPNAMQCGPDLLEAVGSTPVADVEERFGVDFPAGRSATLGGRLVELAGRIPAPGERFLVRGLEVDVLGAGPTRVERLLVRRGAPALTALDRSAP